MIEPNQPPIPFTVIGGFLGSGKTTLLNYLLAQPMGIRYAVLVNDFGEINIDESLISYQDGKTISLTNGCVCCSIVSNFNETIINLLKRRDEYNQIVVEASGVSVPSRIMDIAKLDPELIPNGIITLVDASEVLNFINDCHVGTIVYQQLQSADLLVINKIDLIQEVQLEKLKIWLEKKIPSVVILKTTMGQVSPMVIFGETSPNINNISFMKSRKNRGSEKIHVHDDKHQHLFKSISIENKYPLERSIFEKWSKELPASVFRGKGVIEFLEEPGSQWVWQKVGLSSILKRMPHRIENHLSKILLIGNNNMPSLKEIELIS